MPFRFALQPLLDRRKRIEQQKQLLCALRWRELQESMREVDRLSGSLRAYATGRTWVNAGHCSWIDAAIQAQQCRALHLQTSLAGAQRELIAASRELWVIEKLRERRHHAYEAEEARREELELDEANARKRQRP
jgi:flagellar biosynthesis chaperone FliJ